MLIIFLSVLLLSGLPILATPASDALETITRAVGLVEQGDADGARTTLAGMGKAARMKRCAWLRKARQNLPTARPQQRNRCFAPRCARIRSALPRSGG